VPPRLSIVAHGSLALGLEPRDRERLRRIDHVDQVMGHARSLVDRRLRRPDVHPAVHLHRVDRQQLDTTPSARL